MKKLGYIFILLGIVSLSYSTTLEPYSNEEAYNEKYSSLEQENKNEKFIELRNEYLTAKFKYEDYGLTLFFLGLAFCVLFRNNLDIRIPESKSKVVFLGFFAFLVTIISLFGRLLLDSNRGVYPHWADSYGIMVVVYFGFSIMLFIWYLINLFGLWGYFNSNNTIRNISLKNINYWYAILSVLTILLLILLVAEGSFLLVLSCLLWLMFYVSILIGRVKNINV